MNFVKNVFVSHEGLVLKNYQLVPKSHFNLKGSKDQTFYYTFWKLALEQYLVSTYGKSLKKIKLEQANYLHVYTKWFGYFFWLTDALPKLIKTRHLHTKVSLIYPDEWKNIAYVNQVLDLFPDLAKEVIPRGVHMQVKSLFLPPTRKWSGIIPNKDVLLIKEFILEKIDKENIKSAFGKRIYISREKALRRKPINETGLNELLLAYDYDRVCLEDFSFLEQLAIIHNAESVIGLHGAGLANCLMMKEGTSLIELAPQVRTLKELRKSFQALGDSCNLKYQVLFNKVDLINKQDIYDNDIIVDLKSLNQAIKQNMLY